MQFSPTASVDLMFTGKPDNTSAGKTGQDGAFASHMATAARGKTASSRQPEPGDTPKNSAKATEKTRPTAAEKTTAQTAAPSEPNSSPAQAETQAAVPDTRDKQEASEDLATGTTINGSAGAATAAPAPVLQPTLDISTLVEQRRASASDQSLAIVSRMLDTITSAAAGTTTVAAAAAVTAAAAPASPLAGQSATPTNPSPVQTLTIGENQTLAAAPPLPAGLPENGEIASATRPKFTATSERIPADGAPLQSPATVSFAAETPRNSGTAPLAQLMTTAPANPAPVEPEALQGIAQHNAPQKSNEQVVQNQYGQIITIHQLSDPEGMAGAGIGAKPQATAPGSQSQETNSDFIRAHLPNDAPKSLTNENNAQQQTSKDNQPKGSNPAEALMEGASLAEQTASQKPQFTMGSENQPLVFAHQGASSPLAAVTSSTDATTLRLPSGLTVPDGSVVDQMLSHFTINKQLESGTINLKLHPQELGELRMEIKVEQDNIRAHIVAQNPQAQEMIERHLPRLRETLAQQGLQLQHIEVTVAANDSAGGERYQDNARQQLSQSMNKHTSPSVFALEAEEELLESAGSVNNLSVLA